MERTKSSSKMRLLSKDCGPTCRSKEHARELVSACTKGSTRQLQLYLSKCHNTTKICDRLGRNVLHMAASKGNWEIVLWLLDEKKMDPNIKDLESGWTALHRALFYGQIATARILVNYGADFQTQDKDGLAPLDMIMKDRLAHVEFTSSGLYEAYSWGDNLNSTLGHSNEQRKRQPEIIDFFRKHNISIKDAAMSKYHTVFLSADGRVFTCGHGQGGRLGHGDQQTYVTPKVVEKVHSYVCEKIAAARDHTLLLTENGDVYSYGLNDSHQLGLSPPPDNSFVPKRIKVANLRGKEIKGICAQRFHSVLYTESAVYTFGLNAGQIGHLKVAGEPTVTIPRMVSAFNYKDFHVKYLTASDAATAVATTKGDIYVLHKYQCKKIAAKWLDIQQIAVSGGHLDHSSDLETLREKGGYELVILLLNSAGRVYIWRESDPKMKRCVWSIKRPLHIFQLSLSVQNFAFVTDDGECFKAAIPKKKLKDKKAAPGHKEATLASSPPSDGFTMTVTDLVEREEVVDVAIEKVPLVHRAVSAIVDKKGNNFTVLQAQPNASLTEVPTAESSSMGENFGVFLEEANEFDLIHDVILEVGNNLIPAHRYILASRSEYFEKLFTEKGEEPIPGEKVKVSIDNVHYDMFIQMMKYIYTDTCDVLKIDSEISVSAEGQEPCRIELDTNPPSPIQTFEVKNGKKQSAFEVYDKRKKKSGKGDKKEKQKAATNPVTLLKQMALRFGLWRLSTKLEAVKWVNGKIQGVQGKHLPQPNPTFDRTKFDSLYDVCIKGSDGILIQCHKCVLVARLEYFHSMLGSGWVETSSTEALTLPIPGDILHTVIAYLYTDGAVAVHRSDDVELLCNILVVADQLLISRLKHFCEVKIATLLVLKNVCEVLEFASIYNANRLKRTCQQFICLNLASLLETRSLDILSDEVVEELTTYYRDMVPSMDRRLITPFDESPSIEYLELLETDYKGMELSQLAESQFAGKDVTPGKKGLKKPKKNRTRTKSAGEEPGERQDGRRRSTERQISVGSESDFPIDLEFVAEESAELNPTEEPMEQSPTEVKPRLTIQIPKIDLNNFWTARRVASASEQDGKVPNSGQNISSPVSDGQTLKEIMEQELQAAQTSSSQHKTQERITPVKRKTQISRNEKRRLARQQQKQHEGENPAQSPPAEGSAKPAWTGWGSPPVTTVVTSFKELMLDDEKSGAKPKQLVSAHNTSPPVSSRGDVTTISWGLPQPGSAIQRPQPASSPGTPTSPTEGENPWTRRSSESQAVKFSTIVEDEIQQRASFVRATNKPLALIQIEEQAMQELMQQYAAHTNVDEYITVSRVSTAMATPTWRATSHRR